MSTEDTSETRYDVPAQPQPTCPMIDMVIEAINDTFKDIRGYEKADEAELKEMLWAVERNLDALVGRRSGLLEDIRKNASAIRDWGQGWKDYAKKHAPEPEELETA